MLSQVFGKLVFQFKISEKIFSDLFECFWKYQPYGLRRVVFEHPRTLFLDFILIDPELAANGLVAYTEDLLPRIFKMWKIDLVVKKSF